MHPQHKLVIGFTICFIVIFYDIFILILFNYCMMYLALPRMFTCFNIKLSCAAMVLECRQGLLRIYFSEIYESICIVIT